MRRHRWPTPETHRDDCPCKCHNLMVDDGECGSYPGNTKPCCYEGPRIEHCETCDKRTTLREREGLKLCRQCEVVLDA